ncbi:aspartyl-phosphate phosphatase Spo0E family protein [Bacillus sp. dmp10]|uniref:aspartyl-phosphate phosphatase Spo0E family protein n=1 Tax=Bacillus sp. dmp10 TaxID=2293321 RepID=UPI000E2F9802|nr:aspartyl-phosphate phosphatase Spo0E family protein [Bacillus sp. dmp10]
MEMEKLQELIEEKKIDLIKLAEKYGFRHQQVLRLSQDIDILINLFIYTKCKTE